MRYGAQWTGPLTPRLPTVSLPAESPRPASAIPDRRLSSYALPTGTLASHRQIPTAPAPSFGRTYEDPRPVTRSYSYPGRHDGGTYGPSTQYESGGRIPTGPYGDSTANRPPADRTRSVTPAAPLVSILKSSRTRSHSMSINSEASKEFISAVPVRTESQRSNLSKSHTMTGHRTAPLKEESISLNWPLVKFAARSRSSKPLLYFDVGFDPRQPANLKDNNTGRLLPMSETHRNLPVSTHCTLTRMVIQCPKIGEITVRRSKGIRCIDVFTAVYDAYHERIKRDDLPEDIGRYMGYFNRRCQDSSRPAAEQAAGMRRVDLLRGKRIFDGLSRAGADWKLDFDL